MDVRCEKCQTEYELDEARLKPSGVTVKCTNCGHMFKIRRRVTTNAATVVQGLEQTRVRPASAKPATKPEVPSTPERADTSAGVDTAVRAPTASASASLPAATAPAAGGDEERQWRIRLENGEQRQCRELAALQQWIIAGTVTRESLISRTGKTWKRLGDIAELAQYFTIAEEARAQRQGRPTQPSHPPGKEPAATLLGIRGASAAGGTILPDDDDLRTTGNHVARPITQPPPPPAVAPAPAPVTPTSAKTPPLGSHATATPAAPPAPAARRPPTQPPPPPAKKPPTQPAPVVPADNRSTALWAKDGVSPTEASGSGGPAGPLGGRIKAAADEPAFAGRVRVMPGDDASFNTGKIRSVDDEDQVLPAQRGSRGGLWIVLALLLLGTAGGALYVFVIDKPGAEPVAAAPADAAVAVAPADAAVAIAPIVDAAAPPSPLEVARGELAADHEARLRAALESVTSLQEPGADALRAHLAAAIAQGLLDRAALTDAKPEAEKLKREAKTIVIAAGAAAQRALKAAPQDPGANLAMAQVLRLQGKPARDIKRYLDAATAKATADDKRELTIASGLVLARDGKLDEAKGMFAALDQGDGSLEARGDVRARLRLALLAYAQNKPADAKPLVDQVLAAQPEHVVARALAARIETTVATTDPLPPEEPKAPGATAGTGKSSPGTDSGLGDSYDRLLARANALAESNCTKAMELFSKALEQKPNGVEALTGMGYCHIDAKQFASAFSKFRAALAVSSRYEPALWGVAEAYQQQGRKQQAIDAVKAYLEIYPGAVKAQKALDRLGAGSDGAAPTPEPTNGGGTPAPNPVPDPAPTPPAPEPAPTPAPAAGSASE